MWKFFKKFQKTRPSHEQESTSVGDNYIFYYEDMEKLTGGKPLILVNHDKVRSLFTVSISVSSAYLQLLGFSSAGSVEEAFMFARHKFYDDYYEQYTNGCEPLMQDSKWDAMVKASLTTHELSGTSRNLKS